MASKWTVGKRSARDFTTIQAAIDQVPRGQSAPTTICLDGELFREKITVPPDVRVRLIGQGCERTRISWDDYARKMHADGTPYGTFRTPTVSVFGDGCEIRDLTIVNTAGPRAVVGQAVALAVHGDGVACAGLNLLGRQDTLLTAGSGRQMFERCYIEGDVDFIFGSASVWFERCHLHSLGKGYITAASTPEGVALGYVFWECRVTGPRHPSVFLGRPWRPHASVIWIDSEFGSHILAPGWDNWRDSKNEETARYWEYGSRGPGAADQERVRWAHAAPLSALPDVLQRDALRRAFGRETLECSNDREDDRRG